MYRITLECHDVPAAAGHEAPRDITNAFRLHHGKGCADDHDADDRFSSADDWPEEMAARTFYAPPRDFEAKVRGRLAHWARLGEERRSDGV